MTLKTARKLLRGVEISFTTESGEEYFADVNFYLIDNPNPGEVVSLDGGFTSRQLRLIADAMDEAVKMTGLL